MNKRVLLSVGTMCLAASAYAAPLNYSEDFESYEVGAAGMSGWTFEGLTGSTLTARIVSDTSNKTGEKSLALVDNETTLGSNLGAMYSFSPQTMVLASLDLWVGAIPDETATEFSVMLRSESKAELARLNIAQAGTSPFAREIKAVFGNTSTVIGTFDLDTVIPISLRVDTETDTWAVSIGGGEEFSGKFKGNAVADDVANLYFRFQGANNISKQGAYYIDDISIVPEPTVLGLTGLIGLLAMRRRRA